MLGYGVVDIPRLLWRRAGVDRTLRLYYFRLAKLNSELVEGESAVSALIATPTY